jgi:hypothetical protein
MLMEHLELHAVTRARGLSSACMKHNLRSISATTQKPFKGQTQHESAVEAVALLKSTQRCRTTLCPCGMFNKTEEEKP